MRLSRPRVLLRAALLVTGGVFMLARALEARRGAGEVPPADAPLLSRIALIEALVGVLALCAAGMALLALRRRKRPRTLDLKGVEPPGEHSSRAAHPGEPRGPR